MAAEKADPIDVALRVAAAIVHAGGSYFVGGSLARFESYAMTKEQLSTASKCRTLLSITQISQQAQYKELATQKSCPTRHRLDHSDVPTEVGGPEL